MDEHEHIEEFEIDSWIILTNDHINKNKDEFTKKFKNAQKIQGIRYKGDYETKIVDPFYVFKDCEGYGMPLPFVKDHFRLATKSEIKKSKLMKIFSNQNA